MLPLTRGSASFCLQAKSGGRYCWIAKSYSTLCNPMDCSMPGFPILHYFPEFVQAHVHWVSDAIQPFNPLFPPSPAFSLAQHWGLFQWVSSLHQVAKVLELQHHLFISIVSLRHSHADWVMCCLYIVFQATMRNWVVTTQTWSLQSLKYATQLSSGKVCWPLF